MHNNFAAPPSTPEMAKDQGQARYYTGIPCRNGHYALRRVQDGDCIACRRSRERRRKARRAAEQKEV